MTPATLQETLHDLHDAAMIRQAETIRDWPAGRERHEQATIHVRLALWEQGMGRITTAMQYRVYSILHFVMPDEGTFDDETTPLEALEKEAPWELAYHEQQERQSCPECGDVLLCPAEIELQHISLPDKSG